MIQQIAFYTPDIDESVEDLMQAGYGRWVRDRVEGVAWMDSGSVGVPYIARLAFNYDIMDGIEFEFIQPLTTPNYIAARGISPGQVAHVGWHLEGLAAAIDLNETWGLWELPDMEVYTTHHAGAVPSDRAYHYRIFESERFPSLVKIIRRITREESLEAIEERMPGWLAEQESQ